MIKSASFLKSEVSLHVNCKNLTEHYFERRNTTTNKNSSNHNNINSWHYSRYNVVNLSCYRSPNASFHLGRSEMFTSEAEREALA